jgi:hypothetical protein
LTYKKQLRSCAAKRVIGRVIGPKKMVWVTCRGGEEHCNKKEKKKEKERYMHAEMPFGIVHGPNSFPTTCSLEMIFHSHLSKSSS